MIDEVAHTGPPEQTARVLARACVALAALVLAGAWTWLAVDHGTPLLWNVVVHESGRYTLGQTVLYFSHFLREVPIALAYALFLLGLAGGSAAHTRPRRTAGSVALVLAALLFSASLLTAAARHGMASALLDLGQYRTRDDLAGYGTHWRYHWLSTLWFGATLSALPAIASRIPALPALQPSRGWLRAGWLYFAGLSMLFGLSTDIFTDPRYAGHQAREIMTHALVTLPLGVALVLAWTRPATAPRTRIPPSTLLLLAPVVLIPTGLAAISLSGDVMAQGQSSHGLGAMVAAHYFEHTLDYLLVLLLLTGGLAHSSRRPHPEPGDVATRTAA